MGLNLYIWAIFYHILIYFLWTGCKIYRLRDQLPGPVLS